ICFFAWRKRTNDGSACALNSNTSSLSTRYIFGVSPLSSATAAAVAVLRVVGLGSSILKSLIWGLVLPSCGLAARVGGSLHLHFVPFLRASRRRRATSFENFAYPRGVTSRPGHTLPAGLRGRECRAVLAP